MVKLDFHQRQWAERVIERLSADEDALRQAVYAMIEAESALAVKSSLRDNEQARCATALVELRAVIQE